MTEWEWRRRLLSRAFNEQRWERLLHMEAILSGKITLHKEASTGNIPGILEICFLSYGIIMVVLLGQKAIQTITIYWFYIFSAQNQHLTLNPSVGHEIGLMVPIWPRWKILLTSKGNQRSTLLGLLKALVHWAPSHLAWRRAGRLEPQPGESKWVPSPDASFRKGGKEHS